jgi:hypothetical protein
VSCQSQRGLVGARHRRRERRSWRGIGSLCVAGGGLTLPALDRSRVSVRRRCGAAARAGHVRPDLVADRSRPGLRDGDVADVHPASRRPAGRHGAHDHARRRLRCREPQGPAVDRPWAVRIRRRQTHASSARIATERSVGLCPDHAQLTAEELQQAIEDDQAGKLGVIPVNSLLCRHACRDSSVRGSGGRGRRGQPKPAHDLQADFGIDPAGLVRRWMGAVPCWQWPRRHGSRRLVRC